MHKRVLLDFKGWMGWEKERKAYNNNLKIFSISYSNKSDKY